MKLWKKTAAVLLLILLTGMADAFPAAAADARVTFHDGRTITIEPGSEYAATDLFGGFKGVMPGDVLTEEITIENDCSGFDYICVYMKAVPCDDAGNPVSEAVLSELLADKRRGDLSPIEWMEDFLSQMELRIFSEGKAIYEGDATGSAGLTEYRLVSTLRKRKKGTVTAELLVPLSLTNEYAGRIGEIDWVFLVEGYQSDPHGHSPHFVDGGGVNDWADASFWDALRGDRNGGGLLGAGAVRTGDTSNLPLYLSLLGGSAAVILLLFLLSKKNKEEEEPEDAPEENNPSEKK